MGLDAANANHDADKEKAGRLRNELQMRNEKSTRDSLGDKVGSSATMKEALRQLKLAAVSRLWHEVGQAISEWRKSRGVRKVFFVDTGVVRLYPA